MEKTEMIDTYGCKKLACAVLRTCAQDMINQARLPKRKREAERAIVSGDCDFWFSFLDESVTKEIFLEKVYKQIEKG